MTDRTASEIIEILFDNMAFSLVGGEAAVITKAQLVEIREELTRVIEQRNRSEAHHLALFMRATEAEAMCKRLAYALNSILDNDGLDDWMEADDALKAYRDRKRALSTLEAIP